MLNLPVVKVESESPFNLLKVELKWAKVGSDISHILRPLFPVYICPIRNTEMTGLVNTAIWKVDTKCINEHQKNDKTKKAKSQKKV